MDTQNDNTYSLNLAEVKIRGDYTIDQVISNYEVLVFTLAKNLTGDDMAAREVVEEVFIRIHSEVPDLSAMDLETSVHRFTYDAALKRLVEMIGFKAELVECASDEIIETQVGPQ